VFKALKNSLLKDYKLNNRLTNLINEELKYFFEGDGARVRIVKIQFSDDYNEKIENTIDEF
jgi:DNA-directed RNA polymerase subunit E'/Rpb7